MPQSRKALSWHDGSVLYQIYPRAWLGADAVWLSPCFASEFGDAGYDVTDYLSIAPRYGRTRTRPP
nr:alpha-amylase family glycosyl hydrolase [Streptomyces rhizosphaericus]